MGEKIVIAGAGALGGNRRRRRGRSTSLARYEAWLRTQPRGSATRRPSMGQDMMKGRRTEIEFLNGHLVREGAKPGLAARANERLVDHVTKVERSEPRPDARHVTEPKLN